MDSLKVQSRKYTSARLGLRQKSSVGYYIALVTAAVLVGGSAVQGPGTSLLIAGGLIFMLSLVLDTTRTSAICLGAVLVLGAVEPPRIAGITVVNLALVMCLSTLLIRQVATHTSRAKLRPPIWSALLIIVIMLSSSAVQNLSFLSTPLLAAAVTFLIIKQKKGRQVLFALGFAGIIHASIGLYESVTHSSLIYTGWKDATAADVGGIRRAASLVGDPNYLALTLLCCVPGVLSITRRLSTVQRWMVWVPYCAVLVLTFSRGALLGVFVGLTFFIINRYSLLRHPVKLFLALSGLAATAVTFSLTPVGQTLLTRFLTLDASTRSRSTLQSATFDLFLENWLSGIGLGNLPLYLSPLAHALVPLNASGTQAFLPQTDPLNTYLLVGAEGGVLALTVMLGVLITAFRSALSERLDVASALVGVAIVAATLDLIQSPIIWCLFVVAINLRERRLEHCTPAGPLIHAPAVPTVIMTKRHHGDIPREISAPTIFRSRYTHREKRLPSPASPSRPASASFGVKI